ncbi:EsaB/YukD family protein [Pseudonocardia oroxyli]|uniref:Type VII secretion integral membrane protein EccD n=1 Tax=Pseudonocardia oroxyli TaxID=366584 RepID=A0A1G7GKV8_PSEOR|nr:EsaB/YukD family protein [Pseudonocardia oroxyli]SDE88741.1 type VII secretion integral membrane protein EccD [Pseudonocardia oroxyli]
MEGYRRVTVLGPRSTVDVALPADVAVAELAPMLVELFDEPPSGAPAPWRLDGVAGAPLPPSATLAQLGVLDGELLRIGPARPAPAPPRFDDLPEALAAAVADRAGGADPTPAFACLAAALVLALGLAGLRSDPTWSVVGAVLGLLTSAALLTAVARTITREPDAGRAGPEGGRPGPGDGPDDVHPGPESLTGAAGPAAGRPARTAWALAAVPLAAAAGWLALPGPAGPLGAAVAAALAAFAAQAVLRVVAPAVLAVFLVLSTTALGAAFALVSGASPAGVGTATALFALLAAPLAPRWALGLAGLNPAGGPPDGAVALARGHLAALILAVATLVAGGAVLAATGSGWWGPAFGVVCSVVLALRARGFAAAVPARAQQGAAVLAAAAIAVVAPGPPGLRLAALAVGLGGLLVVATVSRPPLGPVARRTVDLAELALTALAVPLAVLALDLFSLVRGS